MKRRIAMWASVGVLIAGFWAVYFAGVSKDNPIEPTVYTLARVSCPIALIGDFFHFGVKLYWVLLSNAIAYGLVGLAVQTARRQLSHAR